MNAPSSSASPAVAGLDLPLVHEGKVRQLYDAGDGLLLVVASDRISAFDVIMAEPVPDKGRVLTAMSAFWFEHLAGVAGNHLVSTSLDDLPEAARRPELAGRVMLCRRAEMLPIECIVRGYLSGSAWREYHRHGTVHGEPAPSGLEESDRLPEPRFTPSTKADQGHDVNLSFAQAVDLVGQEVAEQARDVSLELYRRGAAWAAERGFLVADTKFELGVVDGELVVADELLTPDSSRFWPAERWHPGSTPPSFDKEPLRRWLDGLDWDKSPPPPPLPSEVVEATRSRYVEAYERLTDRRLASWPGADEPGGDEPGGDDEGGGA
ncbi:MAG: phosphoribosylaminoimidazolesuccinocarboxamide synthase [Actinomycetota bacterium]|nr:phosphoribosylaminoimidazolesuccinocarboxamide synthase [Actinomycetota bacterium]